MADLGQIPEIPVEIPEEGPSRGRRVLKAILIVFIGIVIGGAAVYFGGQWLGFIEVPDPNAPPRTAVIGAGQAEQRIADLESRLSAYSVLGPAAHAKQEIEELTQRREAQGAIEAIRQKVSDMLAREAEYDDLRRELDGLNETIAGAQEDLAQTQRQNTEADTRLRGLRTEVAEYEVQVGKLEVADARRQAAKNALLRDVEQLIIHVRKAIPLTPPEYRKRARVARAEELRDKLQQTNWVIPELLEEYTQLYLYELAMATQENYFIAKIPFVEKNQPVMKWAECVSVGNRMVYFETLDKTFTGICRNTGPSGAVPRYELVVDLPRAELMEIRDIMAQYRPEDYEERIKTQLGEDVEIVGKRPVATQRSQAS